MANEQEIKELNKQLQEILGTYKKYKDGGYAIERIHQAFKISGYKNVNNLTAISDDRTQYVVGFLIRINLSNSTGYEVSLIQKNRPAWQKGK